MGEPHVPLLVDRAPARWRSLPALALYAALAVTASFVWQGAYGFNIGDEGFLWYGVKQVLAGGVPMRDFMAYDPGRYYWCAALMAPCDADGILAVRLAVALFQALGLFAGLVLLVRFVPRNGPLLVGLAVITLMAWSFPRHKLFDVSISLVLVLATAALIDRPSRRRHLLTGLAVGVIAMFGKNHALYGCAGSVIAILYGGFRERPWRESAALSTAWLGGFAVGYSPMVIAMLCVPGLASGLWGSIDFLAQNKGTNLPLPVPWPWLVRFDQGAFVDDLARVLIGAFFIALLAFGALGLVQAFRRKSGGRPLPPVTVAAIALALPYAHYSYSRADIGHLALGIFPPLIGSFSLFAQAPAWAARTSALTLTCLSLLVMLPYHPGWRRYEATEHTPVKVGADTLLLDAGTAHLVANLDDLIAHRAPQGRPFIATPFWPGAYPLADRKSPLWEIYALFPRSDDFQRAEIARVEAAHPAFALVLDSPLDGREEMRFHNTHPLLDAYFTANFTLVPDDRFGPDFRLYLGKEEGK